MKSARMTPEQFKAMTGTKAPPASKPATAKRSKRQTAKEPGKTSAGASEGFNCTREEIDAFERTRMTVTKKGQGTIIEWR